MKAWLYSALLGVVLLCNSCIDRSDYDLDSISINPTNVFPLVTGKLSINDILNDEDSIHIKSYPDGLMYLAYQQNLNSTDIRELFSIPSKSVSRSFIMPGMVVPPLPKDFRPDSIVTTVDLGLSPERLSEIALRAGEITYSTSLNPSSSQLNYEVHLVLPGFKSRTTNKTMTEVIKGSGKLNLSDYTFSLVNNKFDLKLVLVFKKSTGTTTITPASSVNVQLNFGSMEFIYLKGFLGDQSASLDEQLIDVGVFDENMFGDAELSLAAPKISMTVVNSNGVPCAVDFTKLEARKAGTTPLPIVLNPANPVNIAYPTVMGESKPTTVNVVNVKDVLDYAPSQLYYKANARINKGLTSGENFLLDSSKLRIRMNIEVPLYGSASGIVLRDTLEVNLDNLEQSEISAASLKLKLTNQFPLEGNVQFVLADAQYKPLGSLLLPEQTNIIKGSTVSSTGELQSAGVFDGTIELDKTKIENIFAAKYVIMIASLQTSRNAAGTKQDVKFMSDYFLSVEAGISVSAKLTIE